MKETFFWEFSSDAISTLSDLTSEGFEVDWTVRSSSKAITSGFVMQGEVIGMIEFTPEPSDAYTFVHKLEVRMDKKNQGIAGLLLAHVAQDALLDYYVRRYGCSRIANTNRVMFRTAACQSLIDRFLKEGVD